MGTVYFIRHGQRFPLSNFSFLESAFGDEPVVFGELTETGRTRMRQLGATFKDVPIVTAKYTCLRRCEDSLVEFLKGAGCAARAEEFGDRDITRAGPHGSFDTTDLEKAFNSSIRNRKAFDDLVEKYLPGLEKGFRRDLSGTGLIDALAVLDDIGGQKMSAELEELNLDSMVAFSLGSRSVLGKAIRETISEAFRNRDGHTVALVSDVHLVFVLQRVAPQLLLKRPPFGSVIKMTLSESGVSLQYQDQEVELPLAEFQRRIELDMPSSLF